MDMTADKLRLDKYLWAIRIFKTRSLATEACRGGKVKLNGQAVKPAYEVKIGDTFQIQKGPERKVIQVTGLLARRSDAKTAVQHYEDLTLIEDVQAQRSAFYSPVLRRDRGTGRPTKKDRREIDGLQEGWFEDNG